MSGALSGKAAIITGGRRIGAAVALALAGRGMNVALSFNRSRSEAERIATDIEAAGQRALIYQADLSVAAEAQTLIDKAAADLTRLDVLINMASVYSSVPFDQTDEHAQSSTSTSKRRSSAPAPPFRTCGAWGADGSSTSATGWRAADARATRATFLTTWPSTRSWG